MIKRITIVVGVTIGAIVCLCAVELHNSSLSRLHDRTWSTSVVDISIIDPRRFAKANDRISISDPRLISEWLAQLDSVGHVNAHGEIDNPFNRYAAAEHITIYLSSGNSHLNIQIVGRQRMFVGPGWVMYTVNADPLYQWVSHARDLTQSAQGTSQSTQQDGK